VSSDAKKLYAVFPNFGENSLRDEDEEE